MTQEARYTFTNIRPSLPTRTPSKPTSTLTPAAALQVSQSELEHRSRLLLERVAQLARGAAGEAAATEIARAVELTQQAGVASATTLRAVEAKLAAVEGSVLSTGKGAARVCLVVGGVVAEHRGGCIVQRMCTVGPRCCWACCACWGRLQARCTWLVRPGWQLCAAPGAGAGRMPGTFAAGAATVR